MRSDGLSYERKKTLLKKVVIEEESEEESCESEVESIEIEGESFESEVEPFEREDDVNDEIKIGSNPLMVQFEESRSASHVATPQVITHSAKGGDSKKRKAEGAESGAPKLDTISQDGNQTLVLFMNIGMGDCTIVIPPRGGKALLIDAGWTTPPNDDQTFATYAKEVSYLLRRLEVTRLRIILTHGDADHHSLFTELEKSLKCVATITRVYSPAQQKAKIKADIIRTANYDEAEDELTEESETEEDTKSPEAKKQKHVQTTFSKKKTSQQPSIMLEVPETPSKQDEQDYQEWCMNNSFYDDLIDRKKVSPSNCGVFKRKIRYKKSQEEQPLWGLRAHWLACDAKPTKNKRKGHIDNAVSLCMELIYGNASVVLMGDAVGVTEDMAKLSLKNPRDGLTTILKMSHHGSDTNQSNDQNWIDLVAPACAVASAAVCNHGLPRQHVMHRTDKHVWPAVEHDMESYKVTKEIVRKKNKKGKLANVTITSGEHQTERVKLAQFVTHSTGTLAARLTLGGPKFTKVELKWEMGDGCGTWHELQRSSQ